MKRITEEIYGTDSRTLGIIRNIQELGNKKARVHSIIDTLRKRGFEFCDNATRQSNGQQQRDIANSTGDNGDSLANTDEQRGFGY